MFTIPTIPHKTQKTTPHTLWCSARLVCPVCLCVCVSECPPHCRNRSWCNHPERHSYSLLDLGWSLHSVSINPGSILPLYSFHFLISLRTYLQINSCFLKSILNSCQLFYFVLYFLPFVQDLFCFIHPSSDLKYGFLPFLRVDWKNFQNLSVDI